MFVPYFYSISINIARNSEMNITKQPFVLHLEKDDYETSVPCVIKKYACNAITLEADDGSDRLQAEYCHLKLQNTLHSSSALGTKDLHIHFVARRFCVLGN